MSAGNTTGTQTEAQVGRSTGGQQPEQRIDSDQLDPEDDQQIVGESFESKAPAQRAEPSRGEVLAIPTRAMAAIKQKEREKGRQQAIAEYDQKLSRVAKLLGFGSWEELEAADPEDWRTQLQRRGDDEREADGNGKHTRQEPEERDEEERTVSEPKRSATATAKTRSQYVRRLENQNAKLLEDKTRLNRSVAHEERRRRKLERDLAAKDAESQLRVAAVRAGVQDIDYALHLLKQEVRGKPKEELDKFDENAFFGEVLRKQYPLLYKVQEIPATTGVAGGAAAGGGNGADSSAAKIQVERSKEAPKDARKLSREQYLEVLQKHGLRDPSVGMPT